MTDLNKILFHLHRCLHPAGEGGSTDAQLLTRFIASRDEASFAALVRRHGPMVWRLCLRVLGHAQDAEDAFQATFLVLARKASVVVKRESVGSFLYGVAYRIAREAKAINDKRRSREKQVEQMPHPQIQPAESLEWLDHELNLLPEHYRAVIVAYALEGLSRKEAARHLGISEGTVSSRLARGRRLLAKRLGLPAGVLAAALTESTATAHIPASLLCSTTKVVVGRVALSSSVEILVKGALKAMLLTMLKVAVGAVMVMAALGASGLAYRASGQSATEPPNVQPSEVSRLIEQLGSDNFAEREAASKGLEAIGEPALKALQKAATEGRDSEVRRRAKLLVAAIEAGLYRELTCLWGHEGSVFSVAFSPDGKQLLSGSHDKTVRLWDVQTGKELRRFENHRDLVYAVAFSPDGRRILSGSADKTVRLCDVETGNELHCFKGHASIVYAVAFGSDGKRVASASHDKTVRLWDVETGKELRRLEGHPYFYFNSVAFSPDSKQLAAGSGDATVRLWDVETGKELHCFRGHGAAVYGVAFSADGKRILSGSGGPDARPLRHGSPVGTTVRLWEVQSGKELRRFEGHADLVFGVALSPDGRRAVSASFDGTIRVWDIEKGRQSWSFMGHRGWVTAIAFSPDRKLIASSGKDKTVRLWRLPK